MWVELPVARGPIHPTTRRPDDPTTRRPDDWSCPGFVESSPLWEEDVPMRFVPKYPKEFREKIVALMRAGRSQGSLYREFKVSLATLAKWRKQADLDDGLRDDGVKTGEKKELARLRREVAQLREERDILKKAAAWFAQEAVPTRKPPSDS